MAVSSHDVPPSQAPNDTGLVEVHQLAGGAVLLVRLLGALLLLASLFGTYVPFAGGWEAFVAQPWPVSWRALGLAVVTQAAFSWAQWTFKARGLLWWRHRGRWGGHAVQSAVAWWLAYGVALLISAGFSAYTYGQWARPALGALGPVWAGLIIVAVAAILADMLPEWIFVRS